jgi:hypothetical protein
MITEKAYRDLGAAVIRAFIKSKKLDDMYSSFKVYTQRTESNEGKIAFFLEDEISPTVWWSIEELKAVALSSKHTKKRKEEEG